MIALYYATDAQPTEGELTFATGKVGELSESRGGVHVQLLGLHGESRFTYPHVNGSSGLVRRQLEQARGAEVSLGHMTEPRRGLNKDQILSVAIDGLMVRSVSEVASARWWNAAGLWAMALVSSAYAAWRVKRMRNAGHNDA